MEFKSCIRCGTFFVSDQNLCPNCVTKEVSETHKLQAYFESYDIPSSIQTISLETGITVNNLTRMLKQDGFKDIDIEF